MKTIVVVGGTGAQGAAVVRFLASTGKYRILLVTRDPNSQHSQELINLGNIEGIKSDVEFGYDLAAFESAAQGADGVFINTDGFALGEQAETYWGIRLFETAVKAGVKHIVYSGLDNSWRDSGYQADLYVGHYHGKARVQDFIHAQPKSKSDWTIVRSGPYMQMLSEALVPSVTENGVYSFSLPLDHGAIPFIHLEDFGRYVNWIFENPSKSTGSDLCIGTTHASGEDIARAFSEVIGKQAVYNNIPTAIWSSVAFAGLPDGPDSKIGFATGLPTAALNQSFGENFENWWNLYKASAGNKGLIRKDYELLDGILPDRVKNVKEWMEKTGYRGEKKSVLKMYTGRMGEQADR